MASVAGAARALLKAASGSTDGVAAALEGLVVDKGLGPSLPDDVLGHVTKHLGTVHDLARAASTGPAWRDAAQAAARKAVEAARGDAVVPRGGESWVGLLRVVELQDSKGAAGRSCR
jgi:hypothetical protein